MGIIKRVGYLLRTGKILEELKSHWKHKRHPTPPKILPPTTISTLIGSSPAVTLKAPEHQDGNVSQRELEAINQLVTYFKPQTLFEIGTFDGRTTLNLAAHAPPQAHVYTLDLPADQQDKTAYRIKSGDKKFINKPASGERYTNTKFAHKITQLYGDSAQYDFSPFTDQVNFIFIDGSHAYDYVANDTEQALRMADPQQSVIIWHDYGWHEVIKALNEYFKQDPRFQDLKNIKGTSLAVLIQ